MAIYLNNQQISAFSGMLFPHAITHSTNGIDPITPESIGAAKKNHSHNFGENSRTVTVTILASGWQEVTGAESTSFTQLVNVSGLSVNENVNVGLASTATLEQIQAAASAIIMATEQLEGQIKFTAYGEKPTVDIPVQVLIIGIKGSGGAMGATPGLPVFTGEGGVLEVVTTEQGRDYLDVTPYTYGYYGKDLSQVYTAEELHTKINLGDYEGIRMGDYWPITLNGTFHDYAEDTDKTLTDAVVKLEFMPNFYAEYGDNKAPNHCLVCSRDCLPIPLKMRSADDAWYDTEATNPMLGSHLYQTLNNQENGIIKLVEQTELGPYLYSGPNGKGMRFYMETKSAGVASATAGEWNDRGKLFLPTEREVWGQDIWSEHTRGGTGSALQWPIFTGSMLHISKGFGGVTNREAWWNSSSVQGGKDRFCGISHSCNAYTYVSSRLCGIPLCFLLV